MGSMNSERYELLIRELTEQLNKLRNSDELFWGRKVCKYKKIICEMKGKELCDSLTHDFRSLLKKRTHKEIDIKEDDRLMTCEKIVVYSSIYGDYDDIFEPLMIEPECEYVLFTDKSIPADSVWKKGDESRIPECCDSPVLRNRYVKMHPHEFFKNNYSIYLDGNLQIIGRVSQLLIKDLNNNKTGIAMHTHPANNCVFQEAEGARYWKKITNKEYHEIIKYYKKNNMPRNFGLYECNVIARNHNKKECIEIMDRWWELFFNGIKRDQLYFTFAIYSLNYRFEDVSSYKGTVNQSPYFIRRDHCKLVEK